VAIPKVKTSGKRLRTKLTRVKEWARTVKDTVRLPILWNTFCAKLRSRTWPLRIMFRDLSQTVRMV